MVEDADDEEMLVLEAILGFDLKSIKSFSPISLTFIIESFEAFSLLLILLLFNETFVFDEDELDELVDGDLDAGCTWVLVNESNWLAMSFVSWLNDSFKSIVDCFGKLFDADSLVVSVCIEQEIVVEVLVFVAVVYWAWFVWLGFVNEFCFCSCVVDLITLYIYVYLYNFF